MSPSIVPLSPIGGNGRRGPSLPLVLTGASARIATLGVKAVLGRARIRCSTGDIDPLRAIVPTVTVRIATNVRDGCGTETDPSGILAQYLPAGIVLRLRWQTTPFADASMPKACASTRMAPGRLGDTSRIGRTRVGRPHGQAPRRIGRRHRSAAEIEDWQREASMRDDAPHTDNTTAADKDDCRASTRNRYFRGKTMKADDFEKEQRYFIERRRLITRSVARMGRRLRPSCQRSARTGARTRRGSVLRRAIAGRKRGDGPGVRLPVSAEAPRVRADQRRRRIRARPART